MTRLALHGHCLAATLVVALTFVSPAGAVAGAQAGEVRFEPEHEFAGLTLGRVNTALYSYLLFDVYEAALYLAPGASTQTALADDVARRLEVVYLRDIDASDLVRAAEAVLERSVDAASLASLSARLAELHGWFRDVAEGDRFALSFMPGRGTTLELNGERLGSIEGADFARAYFSIWLGEEPLDDDLRAALLAPVDGAPL